MVLELTERGLQTERQVALPVLYKDMKLNINYRIDLLVNQTVIVELKSVHKLENIHQAQLLTYLKMAHKQFGLLINFNVPIHSQAY